MCPGCQRCQTTEKYTHARTHTHTHSIVADKSTRKAVQQPEAPFCKQVQGMRIRVQVPRPPMCPRITSNPIPHKGACDSQPQQ